jgi:Putative beta-barrel porin-2, OmpL-like. bbp2
MQTIKSQIRIILFLATALTAFRAEAQLDSLRNNIAISLYGEAYYNYDFSQPVDHLRPGFTYNHKRHNEVNFNLILAKFAYADSTKRARLGLMSGNYAQFNLAAEPTWAQFVYEANIGVSLSKKHNLWLDVGVLPSHIGFESAIGGDCWTLTRSLMAENSPYYESGAKLTYTSKNKKWNAAYLVLNGWQQIQRSDSTQQFSWGVQVQYQPNDLLAVNYSNYIGSIPGLGDNYSRNYNNIYATLFGARRYGLTLGFDYGQNYKNDGTSFDWYTYQGIVRYRLTDKLTAAARWESFVDPDHQILVQTDISNGMVNGVSANLDYKTNDKTMLRLEVRNLDAGDGRFANGEKTNMAVTGSMIFRL